MLPGLGDTWGDPLWLGVSWSWEIEGGVLEWLGESWGGMEGLWRFLVTVVGPGPGGVPGDGGGGSVMDWADGCGGSGIGFYLGRIGRSSSWL